MGSLRFVGRAAIEIYGLSQPTRQKSLWSEVSFCPWNRHPPIGPVVSTGEKAPFFGDFCWVIRFVDEFSYLS